MAGLVLVAVLGLLWTSVFWEYRRAEADVLERLHQRAAAMALAFGENTRWSIRAIDHFLVDFRAQAASGSLAQAQAIASDQITQDVTAQQIGVVNAQGVLTFSTAGVPPGGVNVADRDHFVAQRDSLTDEILSAARSSGVLPVSGRSVSPGLCGTKMVSPELSCSRLTRRILSASTANSI